MIIIFSVFEMGPCEPELDEELELDELDVEMYQLEALSS